MIILGIDPGTATTGWGAVKKSKKQPELMDYGAIFTSPKQTTGERLSKLHAEISSLIKQIAPDVLVIEKLYFFKNLKTALPVSEARGVILLAASQQKIKVVELTPLQIKMGICGYGRADKKQIQKMVKETLCLEKIPKPDDAADALAAAVCGAYSHNG
ncbi:MAG: crossover junction endodeoxyribonuclease RuvC [Candidatus Pacebacteria bacterium]|nr:crossover junction endodeoxyribonuclease RuvC [Candidatus Paceibacterota bacterium]